MALWYSGRGIHRGLARMKLINCSEQDNQPMADSEEELVEFDVNYLIKCFNQVRNVCYSIVERPDVRERNMHRPDYLIKDNQTGELVAVEYARFFESQDKREHVAVAVKKGGGHAAYINFPNDVELGKRLSEFFDDKLSKSQFAGFSDCERILLVRNRWGGIGIKRFLAAEPYFKPLRRGDCDHFYIIAARQLIEVF